MRLLALFVLMQIFSVYHLSAQKPSDGININFSPKDFNISQGEDGLTRIGLCQKQYVYSNDTLLPALPYVSISIRIPINQEFQDFTFSYQKSELASGVVLAPNPSLNGIDGDNNKKKKMAPAYRMKKYPDTVLRYSNTTRYKSCNVINFLLCPYEYNVEEKKLYFLDSLVVFPVLRNTDFDTQNSFRLDVSEEYINSYVENPETQSGIPSLISNTPVTNSEDYDYLIITNDSLKDSFQRLLNWKRQKGVRGKIVVFNPSTAYNPCRYIKDLIQREREDRNLKYVLLGGDDKVIPTYYSQVASNLGMLSVPTDMYYACSGSDDWDIYANDEAENNIDYSLNVYVTRCPVRNPEEADAFVDKIINYERFPDKNGWNNRFLLAGSEILGNMDRGPRCISDSQIESELLDSLALRNWIGTTDYLFDTYSNIPRTYLVPRSFQSLLQEGYNFINISSHGTTRSWNFNDWEYTVDSVYNLSPSFPTIITTTACETNAFDLELRNSPEPCLSEAFLRSRNSNVVAYYGPSRLGWSYVFDNYMGPTMHCLSSFYTHLLEYRLQYNRHFGEIVALQKTHDLNYIDTSENMLYTILSMNPMGDPEMPIFTETPLEFTNYSWNTSSSGLDFELNTRNCRICVMSMDEDHPLYQIYNNATRIHLDTNDALVSVCVTRNGYRPKVFYIKNDCVFIQNENISNSSSFNVEEVRIGQNVLDEQQNGEVIFYNANIEINANKVLLDKGTKIGARSFFRINVAH